MLVNVAVLLVCLPVIIAAKCGEWSDCNSCASHKEGDGMECRWCDTSKSCHDFSIDPDCPSSQIIDMAYDCPVPPRNGFAYTDEFGRRKILPIAAAAHAANPQACLTNAVNGALLKRKLTVQCDSKKNDTCSGYTAVSHFDRAVLVSFRGTSGTEQLIEEGVESIFKAKKSFVGGGNVDAYFYDAFYALWNAGMRDDLLTLKAANPDYELWVRIECLMYLSQNLLVRNN
uniref:Fungal lipase-like domain-containing protein n=1 Tax=Plectus sambesii TaxID=2011161 RepID=A0A914WXA2_9BILA